MSELATTLDNAVMVGIEAQTLNNFARALGNNSYIEHNNIIMERLV